MTVKVRIIIRDEVIPYMDALEKVFEVASKEALEDMKGEFHGMMRHATRDWTKRNVPLWKVQAWRDSLSGLWSMDVQTDSLPWLFVDKGTRPHAISPRDKRFLAYRQDYRPKTFPDSFLPSEGGGRYMGPWVTRMRVMHPGIKAREITNVIGEELEERFPKEILLNAVRRALTGYTEPPVMKVSILEG